MSFLCLSLLKDEDGNSILSCVLKGLISRQDDAVDQSLDTVAELTHEVEFYRKQVNHLLALLNILAKGA